MEIETYAISVACNGELGRDDATAKENLIEKLFALAKIGYIPHPFEQIREGGTTGLTHYQIIVLSEQGNTHRADEIPNIHYCTRCF